MLRTLYAGAAISAAAGLLMGSAAKPNLDALDRPAGPQMLASVGGARSAEPFADDSASFARYGAKLPDYVLGTDAAKALLAYPSAYLAPPLKLDPAYEAPLPDAPSTRMAYADDPPATPSFPSVDGAKPDDDQPSDTGA